MKNIYSFILGCTGSSLLCGLSLVAVSRGYSLVEVLGPLTGWKHRVLTTGPPGKSPCQSFLNSYPS